MQTKLKELIILESAALLLVSLALKETSAIISFFFTYLLLFFLPGLPLVLKLKDLDLPGLFIVINLYGLAIIPPLYFIFGFFIMPVSKPVMVAIPLVVSAITFYFSRK